jgi:hypothetical protein
MRILREVSAGEVNFWVINLDSLPVEGPFETAQEALVALREHLEARRQAQAGS